MNQESRIKKNEVQHSGVLSNSIGILFTIMAWLLAALLFSIIIEWIGMITWWEDEGKMHSREMLEAEIGYLGNDFAETIMTSHPAIFARYVADIFYEYMFVKTEFITLIKWLEMPAWQDSSSWRLQLRSYYLPISDFILAAMTISQVFAVRLAVLILATPAFIMFALVGLVDGLVERDLRKWGGGRESSFVYHYAKKPIIPIFAMSWIVYLSLPISIHPNYIILPFAIVFGVFIAITASKFKKYL